MKQLYNNIIFLLALLSGLYPITGRGELLTEGPQGESNLVYSLDCWQNGSKIINRSNLHQLSLKSHPGQVPVMFSKKAGNDAIWTTYLVQLGETVCLLEGSPNER